MWRLRSACLVGSVAGLVVFGAVGCGSSEVSTQHPRTTTAREASPPQAPEEEGFPEAAEPQGPCNGADCFQCGDAVCLPGFYCDEPRGVCSWLPQCEQGTGCECIERILPGCRCEMREGGVYVDCQ